MEKQVTDYSFFPKTAEILRSIRRVQLLGVGDRAPHRQLDTLGTSGSKGQNETAGRRDDCKATTRATVDVWQKEYDSRQRVKLQMETIFEAAKLEQHLGEEFLLNKAKASLQSCGSAYLVHNYGPNAFEYVGSYHCKKKYCPRCAAKKTRLLIAKYSNFFDSHAHETAELLAKYDICFLTVTLRHGEASRQGWYFKELQTHWRNSLKYGAFNRFVKGGAYQTEVNVGENGFHIHRHCIVLIPKAEGVAISGKWIDGPKGREFRPKNTYVRDQLRDAWHQRTGDSFQIDLKPIDPAQPLEKSLSEIFKYLSNGTKEKKGIVDGRIVKELVRAPREKFYGRFGILHNRKELNINDKDIYQAGADDPLHAEAPLYIARGLRRTRKGWSFGEVKRLQPSPDGKSPQFVFRDTIQKKTNNAILAAHDASFRKHEVKNPLPDF